MSFQESFHFHGVSIITLLLWSGLSALVALIVLSYLEVLHALPTNMLLVHGLINQNFEKYNFNQDLKGRKTSHENCDCKNTFNISVA